MPTFTQANQPVEVITPLGKDVLLLTSFQGEEGISRLFQFRIDMIADAKKDIAFDKLLGQKIAIRLSMPNGKVRHFNGICSRFSQGEGDADFIAYQMEIVPQFWLLTKKAQCRIFQQLSVPDILKKVLTGVDIVNQIEGTFHPRNYCVQYRETDFNFASRLMEEEGIFYYFTHAADGHKMVLANTPASHPPMPVANAFVYEKLLANTLHEDRILSWQKQQELVTGQVTLWDHKFEMHGKNLEAKKTVPETIQVGKVAHKVKAGNAESREVYDYPGDYAPRFDGVNSGGGDQPPEIQKILKDNERVATIRSQQEAVQSVNIHGSSTCRNLVSGHKFTLQKHGSGDGDYLLATVRHQTLKPVDYRNAQSPPFQYMNSFTAIPFAMPFRPQRVTPRPFVQGTQTAVVVGPAGEEIFCDKYGRVKVQFHWDREGKLDASSSCWVRVSTLWAGKAWGITNVPRIGHEVIIGFEEGDPDLPIIMGSVFNADHMPPGELPKDKMVSGLRSNSTPGGGGFNGLIFNDTKKKELITLHAQFDMDATVEHDNRHTVKNDETWSVVGHRKHTVNKSETNVIDKGRETTVTKGDKLTIADGQSTTITGGQTITIDGGLTEKVTGGVKVTIDGGRETTISGNDTQSVSDSQTATVGANQTITIGGKQKIGVTGAIEITSDASITLTVGGSSIKIEPAAITIVTKTLKMEGQTAVEVKGAKITSQATAVNEMKGAMVKLN